MGRPAIKPHSVADDARTPEREALARMIERRRQAVEELEQHQEAAKRADALIRQVVEQARGIERALEQPVEPAEVVSVLLAGGEPGHASDMRNALASARQRLDTLRKARAVLDEPLGTATSRVGILDIRVRDAIGAVLKESPATAALPARYREALREVVDVCFGME